MRCVSYMGGVNAKSAFLLPFSVRLALVCLSALALRATGYPAELWQLSIVAWAPLIVAVASTSGRRVVLLGLVHGVLTNWLIFGWIWPVLRQSARFDVEQATIAFAAFLVDQGVRSVALVLFMHFATKKSWPLQVAFPCALVATELAFPCFFPWYTATLVSAAPAWSQLAEYGGPLALTFWIALVNAALAAALIRWRRDHRFPGSELVVAVAVVAAVSLFGRSRIRAIEQEIALAPLARIGVVQGNLAPAHVETQDPVPQYRADTLQLLSEQPLLDLVIWPETAIFQPIRTSRLRWFLRDYVLYDRATKSRIGVPLLAGMKLEHDIPEGGAKGETAQQGRTNSAVLIAPGGVIRGTYTKVRLLPLTETELVPRPVKELFGMPSGPELLGAPGLQPGASDQTPLQLGTHTLATSICYEEIFHRAIRTLVVNVQPDLLITLSSDSWFGSTSAAWLHLSVARLRAIEHRKFFLRATTTGITTLIDPAGREDWALPPNTRTAGVATVRWMTGGTVYGQLGDTPWIVLSIASLSWLILASLVRDGTDRSARSKVSEIAAEHARSTT